jgi:hypothetical protein
MSNLFKGYAQKSDYSGNLLKGQDPSDKILEEGKRYLSGWKEVSQGEQQNQANYLAALEAKFQAEEADRARNRKLESYFAEGFEKALTTRHEGLIKNAEAKLTASQATAKKLEGWSESAVKLGVKGAQGFAKARQDHGMNLAIDLGLSWNTAKGIQDATGVLDDTYQGTNAAVLEARKKGASWEQINQIHKLSWLGNQGFRVGVAMNAGEDYRVNGIIKKQSNKYDFKGRQMSLHDATAEGNIEAFEVIRQKIRTEYLNEVKENTGISNKLLAKYARDNIVRAEGRVRTTLMEKNAKAEQSKIQAEQAKLTETRIKEGTYWEFVQKKFGPNGEGRAGVLAAEHNNQIDAITRGLIGPVEIEYLKNMEIEVDGKKVKYGNKFTKRALELDQALVNYNTKVIASDQLATKTRNAKLVKNTLLFRNELLNRETPLEPARLASMIAESNRLYGTDNMMSKMLATFVTDHTSEANDTIYEDTLQKLKSQGMVTTSIVKSMMLSPENEADWMKVAKEQDPAQPNEAELKLLEDHVEARVEDILHSYGFESEDVTSAALAVYTGKGRIKKYFTTYAQDPKLSRGQVLTQALERFEVDVKNDYKITTTGAGDTFKPHFGTFSLGAKRHAIPLSEMTAEQFAANPKLPYEKVLLEPVTVREFFDNVSQGRNVGFPTDVSHYVSKFGIGPNGEVKMTELMFLEAQMKLIDPEFEIPPQLLQMHKVAFSQIKPEYQKLIVGAHQSTNGIHVALKYSGFEHKDAPKSNNFAERNKTPYFNMVRNPEHYHAYLNMDPQGDPDKLDWTEMLMMGAY